MSQNKSNPEQSRVAIIIIDSGFRPDVVSRVKNLLAYYDLSSGLLAVGQPLLAGIERQKIEADTQDPLDHGTVVLERLLAFDSELPFVLVRAFNQDGSLIRSRFEEGRLVANGWTEAYLWAQNICAQSGYLSVANCSFGGFHHALDGSGWESHQLGKVVGVGKAGHLIAAAAGPGDGRSIHASLTLNGGEHRTVFAQQPGASVYNLWVNRRAVSDDFAACGAVAQKTRDFTLEVTLDGRSHLFCRGGELGANLWNGKQQLTFDLPGAGSVAFTIALAEGPSARFDIFISSEDGARFGNFIDDELVSEPAVFSQVIAVGLEDGLYGNCQVPDINKPDINKPDINKPDITKPGISKPDILLPGPGPISFRTPEVTYRLALMLSAFPATDVADARVRLCN